MQDSLIFSGKAAMDTDYKYNLGLFIINYLIVGVFSYDFLTRHAFHQHPILFLLLFGFVGLVMAAFITKLKAFIPLKTLSVNIISSFIAAWIYILLFEQCSGVGCDRNFQDYLYFVVYLFVILKFYVSVLVITFIYGLLKVNQNKFKY